MAQFNGGLVLMPIARMSARGTAACPADPTPACRGGGIPWGEACRWGDVRDGEAGGLAGRSEDDDPPVILRAM